MPDYLPGFPPIFSPCRTWRYTLPRVWEPERPACIIIGLNPSTADEVQDDPTIRRCVGFAQREGCGRLIMLNLFAFRATDPKVMKAAADPVGPDNDLHLMQETTAPGTRLVIAAWGTHGKFRGRGGKVKWLLRTVPMYALNVTKDGHPGHPLYLPADAPLIPYNERAKG